MKRVANILASKGSEVFTVDRQATVLEAVREMATRNVGALVVTEQGELFGILSERDVWRRVILADRAPAATLVGDVATRNPLTITADVGIDECMALMTTRRVRHLPVLQDGKLAGMISIGDVVKHLLDEKEFQIQALTDYIAGKYPG
jgi:CBS domain-containing protein